MEKDNTKYCGDVGTSLLGANQAPVEGDITTEWRTLSTTWSNSHTCMPITTPAAIKLHLELLPLAMQAPN